VYTICLGNCYSEPFRSKRFEVLVAVWSSGLQYSVDLEMGTSVSEKHLQPCRWRQYVIP
jgi:hypothetical protein